MAQRSCIDQAGDCVNAAACCAAECLFEHVQVFCETTRANQNVRFVPMMLTMHIRIWIVHTWKRVIYICRLWVTWC